MFTKASGRFNRCQGYVLTSVLFTALLLASSANAFGWTGHPSGGAQIYRQGPTINPNKLALPGVIVVKFKSGVVGSVQKLMNLPELQGRIVREANVSSMSPVLGILHVRLDKSSEILNNIYLVHYSGSVTPAFLSQALDANPDIQYAEPHYMYKVSDVQYTPNDSLLSQQYALSKIDAFNAWNITLGDSSVIVGIVDTGVDWMHPDLFANIWQNPHWQTDTNYPDDSIGWDFGGINGTPDNNPMEDSPAHGTHVAGIVAAVANNRIGIAGVAPGCRIMPVKVSEADQVDPTTGEPYIVYGFEGIAYAANNGARVINCSWGGVGYSQYEQDVITYAESEGALVVAAAGNDHSTEFQTPAYYAGVLSVAATDGNDVAAYFTNYSYNVSVSAPGLDIISTWGTDSYRVLSGTSMASPCAAGVAALVASEHPNYTPEQILEQVRVSSDNINSINPGYVDELGYGRVNAYRALTYSSPGVQVSNITMSDSVGGNNDGIYTDGETIQVFGKVTDWLQPTSNLRVSLSSNDPNVTIVNGSVAIGALQTKGSYELHGSNLTFKVDPGTPTDHEATFFLTITDGNYTDYSSFNVLLNPMFNQMDVNNIYTTISAKGNIGFNDYPNNTQGVGFVYTPDNNQLLFEGAFMAGTEADKVVDVARDSTQYASEEDNDFKPLGLVTIKTPGTVADQEAFTAFTDSNATSNRIGIQVDLHSFAFKSDSTANFIILQYAIKNLNSSAIRNFYAGLFLDWDIGPSGANNIAAYDKNYQLGYAYDSTRLTKTYAGCALLSGGNPNFTAIDNASPTNGIYTGFSKLHKWTAMSSGTLNSFAGPSDISMVMAGGPVVIQPADSTVLTFVLAAGDTLQDLERAVAVAKGTYDQIVGPGAIPTLKNLAELYQNYPNPFNPTTTISFALKAGANVTVDVYNVIGQKVGTLTNGAYPSGGPYYLKLSSDNLASGVYFVRLTAKSASQTYTDVRKIMVLK